MNKKKPKKKPGISPPKIPIPVEPGFLFDDRSGTKKMYGGRTKDRSLSSLDSWQDKKKEQDLWDSVREGKRFVEQEHKIPDRPQIDWDAKRAANTTGKKKRGKIINVRS